MFSMISEKKYYQHIYSTITALLFNKKDVYLDRYLNLDKTRIPIHVIESLSEIAKIYDYDMTRKFLVNMDAIFEWQESIIGTIDVEATEIAVEYVTFCCVCDKILDSKRFSKDVQKNLIKYININSFSLEEPFVCKEKDFHCIFKLVDDIRNYLINFKGNKLDKIMEDINDALLSENFMSYRDLHYDVKESEIHLLIDKSVKFESSALKLSLLPYDVDCEARAKLIGEIFWLIDDICDLLDDYKSNRINSLLYYNNNATSLTERLIFAVEHIDFYIELLKYKVDLLRQCSGDKMYCSIKEQIWWWLSNARRLSIQ